MGDPRSSPRRRRVSAARRVLLSRRPGHRWRGHRGWPGARLPALLARPIPVGRAPRVLAEAHGRHDRDRLLFDPGMPGVTRGRPQRVRGGTGPTRRSRVRAAPGLGCGRAGTSERVARRGCRARVPPRRDREPLRPDRLAPARLLARGLRPDRDLGHGLVWTLFDEAPDAPRDFLYLVERERPFTAIVRSARPPASRSGLWTRRAQLPFPPGPRGTDRSCGSASPACRVTWTRTELRRPTPSART